MANPVAPGEGPQRARKPMYEDEHSSCSVLVAKFRNEHQLLTQDTHDQFRWLHRFYLVLDRIAESHRVYKLYGGPHGFMISTGVAEPDENHAATLLKFAVHLHQAVRAVKLPGMVALDLVMVLTSGPASSGLLGTTSLTYQIVGSAPAVARELMETQLDLPFLITGGMHAALKPVVAQELRHIGSVELRCLPGQREEVYSLARYADVALTQPGAPPKAAPPVSFKPRQPEPCAMVPSLGAMLKQQAAESEAGSISVVSTPTAPPSAEPSPAPPVCCAAISAGKVKDPEPRLLQRIASSRRRQRAAANADAVAAAMLDVAQRSKEQVAPEKKAAAGLPSNTTSTKNLVATDLMLRFDDPHLEDAYTRYSADAAQKSEQAWLLLSLMTMALYCVASLAHSSPVPMWRMLQFNAVPVVMACLWRWSRDLYYQYREAAWFLQRCVVLAATSVPSSFVFTQPSSVPFLAFGLGTLVAEVMMRRMRLHLQLLNSMLVYVVALCLMSVHSEGSSALSVISPSYLSFYLLVTTVAPIGLTVLFEYNARVSFQQAAAASSAPGS